jgi:hypothetical protein
MIEYTVKVYSDRTEWYFNGKLHREDGPAIEYADGSKYWYLGGQLHREDGPAITWADGSKLWFRNGQLHREDGPAVDWVDGSKECWLKGKKLSEEEFDKHTSVSKRSTCEGRTVVIDGVTYQLTRAEL